MEQVTTEASEGSGVDLSALLGSLGKEGGPDLTSLLELVKGKVPEGREGEKAGEGIDFASLLGMLGGIGGIGGSGGIGGEERPPSPPPTRSAGEDSGGGTGMPPFDPALLSTFQRAMKAMREPDRNIQLLQALRPFLEPDRQWKIDEAIKFLHLMKLAPLLQGLPLGG